MSSERRVASSEKKVASGCAMAAIIWLAIGLGALAQSPWDGRVTRPAEVDVSQVQFLAADAAEILDDNDDGVVVLVEGLEDESQYGVMLRTSEVIEWIEVHNAERPFPPRIYEPIAEGKFLVRGEPGQRYHVSLRGDGIPSWIEVTIAGDPSGPDPPEPPDPEDPDLSELTELSRQLATELDDPTTAKAIQAAIRDTVTKIRAECESGDCPPAADAKHRVVTAIEDALLYRPEPNVHWTDGWRDPISDYLTGQLDTTTTLLYLDAISAAADGLE